MLLFHCIANEHKSAEYSASLSVFSRTVWERPIFFFIILLFPFGESILYLLSYYNYNPLHWFEILSFAIATNKNDLYSPLVVHLLAQILSTTKTIAFDIFVITVVFKIIIFVKCFLPHGTKKSLLIIWSFELLVISTLTYYKNCKFQRFRIQLPLQN